MNPDQGALYSPADLGQPERPVPGSLNKTLAPAPAKAWQRVIRERQALKEPRPPIPDLRGCTVDPISRDDAKQIILEYEWLGTVGRGVACYGLHTAGGELLGVAVFGWPGSVESRDLCGKENREKAICLERGACVHYAPPHAASFLISRAVKLAAKTWRSGENGTTAPWRIFYAYADPEAGEVGTVYQACNWIYLGQGVGRTPGRMRQDWLLPDGQIISSRTLRHRESSKRGGVDTVAKAFAAGWQPVWKHPKHKYVWFELHGLHQTQRRALLEALRFKPQNYPQR